MRRRGHTLIESLVGIAILALLISALLPTLAQAREEGKKVVRPSNPREVGTAIGLYLSDDANLPWTCIHAVDEGGNAIFYPGTILFRRYSWGGMKAPRPHDRRRRNVLDLRQDVRRGSPSMSRVAQYLPGVQRAPRAGRVSQVWLESDHRPHDGGIEVRLSTIPRVQRLPGVQLGATTRPIETSRAGSRVINGGSTGWAAT